MKSLPTFEAYEQAHRRALEIVEAHGGSVTLAEPDRIQQVSEIAGAICDGHLVIAHLTGPNDLHFAILPNAKMEVQPQPQ